MAERCACIDIGANTTRVLVADVEPGMAPTEVRCDRTLLPLHPGSSGRLGEAAALALRDVVAVHLETAANLGAACVRVVATGPLRAAADRAAVLSVLDVPVDVLSGAEEAQLAFAGATAGLGLQGSVGVIDVGGSSTELAVGTCVDGATWTLSLPLGSAGLAATHLHADPPDRAELLALSGAARSALEGVACPRPRSVLAVGGAGSSLRRLCGDRLDEATLQAALATLMASPRAGVVASTGLRPDRVRLLPAALVLLAAAARALGGPARLVGGGVREGVVVGLAAARQRP